MATRNIDVQLLLLHNDKPFYSIASNINYARDNYKDKIDDRTIQDLIFTFGLGKRALVAHSTDLTPPELAGISRGSLPPPPNIRLISELNIPEQAAE